MLSKSKFYGNYTFCGTYGHKDLDLYKKKKEQGEKGIEKSNNFKGKKNNNNLLLFVVFTPSLTLS